MSSFLYESSRLLRIILNDRPTVVAVSLLAVGVVLLVVAYGVSGVLMDRSSVAAFLHTEIGLSRDRSMGEIVNYGLAFLAATSFFLSFVALRTPMYLFAALLMGFIWLDDSAMYHERLGGQLVRSYDLPAVAGLRPQDLGELLAWSAAGLVLGLVLLFALRRRALGDLGVLALLSLCFGLLVLCGVVADLLHVLAPRHLNLGIGLVEDGGEMLAVTLIAGLALGLARNGEAYRAACLAQAPPAPAQPVIPPAPARPVIMGTTTVAATRETSARSQASKAARH